eukprot:gene7248-9880_t
MTNQSLSLRIGAIFLIFVVSAVGIGLPLLAGKIPKDGPMFMCLKCLSAGVMLGIALIHLLADANADLSEVVPDYNLAFALTCLGIILVLSIEQFALILAKSPSKIKSESNDLRLLDNRPRLDVDKKNIEMEEGHVHNEDCGFVKCEHNHAPVEDTTKIFNTSEKKSSTVMVTQKGIVKLSSNNISELKITQSSDNKVHNQSYTSNADINDMNDENEAEIFAGIMKANTLQQLITAYAMEVSIAVHSLIIGFDMGLLSGTANLATLAALLIAISFHQFIEGIGIGVTIIDSRHALGTIKVFIFQLIFCSTVSIGIIVGILTSSQQNESVTPAVLGTANSLAAGSLLYVSLTEMLGNYFMRADLNGNGKVKASMIGSFAAGVAFAALLAVWA